LRKIKVTPSSGTYNIYIGASAFEQVYLLVPGLENKKILIICDENVFNLHGKNIRGVLSSANGTVNFYKVKPGEKSKSYRELNRIYSFLIDNNYGRDSVILVIGGGVTGDLGAFAASTYMRGIRLVNIPTTLLAAVDSSIGGKTGINFNKRKNMVGTFYQPEAVIIDTEFINTLPEKEITSGIGEIVKYAFLGDEKLYTFIDKNITRIFSKDSKAVDEIVYQSALIKAGVVSQDEKEGGIRKILNLGHTFAHAYESGLAFKITHGEAVTAGVISALLLSHKLGLISSSDLKTYLQLPKKIKVSKRLKSFDTDNAYSIMFSDKKNREGKIKLVLLSGIGKLLVDVEAGKDDVIYALNKTKEIV
jgi:3-dehydroquinate synthase